MADLLPQERLIVALDVDSEVEALKLVEELEEVVETFKVGFQLFTTTGPHIINKIQERGLKVFLDLKFFDIPNTVIKGILQAARLGVSMITLHTLMGENSLKKICNDTKNLIAKENLQRPLFIGVTILTSMDQTDLSGIGIVSNLKDKVLNLAKTARISGLDGIVASVSETSLIKQKVSNKNFVVITPGIRPSGTDKDDQKRTSTPQEAIKAGSDFLVVGRPIIKSSNPKLMAERIIKEIKEGLYNEHN
jgi:orotidine-5'-phosphate decarboxylase